MFDLIGFWASVSLIVFLIAVPYVFVLEVCLGGEFKKITGKYCKFTPVQSMYERIAKIKGGGGDLSCAILVIMTILLIITFFINIVTVLETPVYEGIPLTYIETISKIALFLTPVMSYVAVVSAVVFGYALLVRPTLIKLYILKEKIDKL